VSISVEQRKKLGLSQPESPAHQEERTPQLEHLEEGQEIAPEVAERLQPQMGNQAVAALLSRTASTTQTATGTADFELAEDVGQAVDEEYEGGELQLPDVQMGGGGGDGGPGEAMPWELSHLFGGDDEPAPPPKRRKRRRGVSDLGQPSDEEELFEDDEALPLEHVDHIENTMGPTPKMREEYRTGDARYRAIEAGLSSPHAIGRRILVPEAMVDRTDHLDPIGRATEIGRFLRRAATQEATRSLSRATAQPVSALLPKNSGHAGATARLASLTVCAEALEGGGVPTDNAIRLALCHDAWPTALDAARTLAEHGQVQAIRIVETAGKDLGPGAEGAPRLQTQLHTLTGVRLGRHALDRILPESHLPMIPWIRPEILQRPSTDPNVSAVDAILQELTGGRGPTDLPEEQRLDTTRVRPVLDAATKLVNTMGQAQVELAAAAIALIQVRPGSPARSTLKHTDKALRQLARSVVRSGDRLHKATGTPIAVADELIEQTVTEVRNAATAFSALRTWSLSAIAEALYR
jgi:hypothetical protein